jgi:hypothetical protein
MLRLYIALVRSNLEYASVVWNSITSTDASKLELIQQKFAALCFYCFFPQVRYCYTLAVQELNLHTLSMRRHRLDAVFLTQVYSGCKFCPLAWFSVCSSCYKCPSARCASAANAVCRDDHVFGSRNILLRHILQDSLLYFIALFLLSYYYYMFIFLVFILTHYYLIIIIIIVPTLCCVCNWPCGCWLGT